MNKKIQFKKMEKEKVDLSMELSKTKAKLHQLETIFKPKKYEMKRKNKTMSNKKP